MRKLKQPKKAYNYLGTFRGISSYRLLLWNYKLLGATSFCTLAVTYNGFATPIAPPPRIDCINTAYCAWTLLYAMAGLSTSILCTDAQSCVCKGRCLHYTQNLAHMGIRQWTEATSPEFLSLYIYIHIISMIYYHAFERVVPVQAAWLNDGAWEYGVWYGWNHSSVMAPVALLCFPSSASRFKRIWIPNPSKNLPAGWVQNFAVKSCHFF